MDDLQDESIDSGAVGSISKGGGLPKAAAWVLDQLASELRLVIYQGHEVQTLCSPSDRDTIVHHVEDARAYLADVRELRRQRADS